jgi:hypothetical protein
LLTALSGINQWVLKRAKEPRSIHYLAT